MILLRLIAVAAVFLLGAARAGEQPPARPGVLDEVRKRGYVSCGIAGDSPGFSQHDDKGEWSGFDVDFCRALAAAVFDDPSRARFTVLPAKERLSTLEAGWVDLLAGGVAWTEARDTSRGLLYVAVSFHDGQGFMTRAQKSVASAKELADRSICVQEGTVYELDLAEYFGARDAAVKPQLFPTFEAAAKAYDAGQCEALTADLSLLHALRTKLSGPSEHAILPDMVAKAPRGPIVRQGDDQWFSLVRWTLFAMIEAEELGVSAVNVDRMLKSESSNIRRLLGVDGEFGGGLGLPANWAYRIVRHVGNYGDLFERNLGRGSPYAMERRLNALWSNGGLMFAPAVR